MRPFQGLLVLDFSQFLTGPSAPLHPGELALYCEHLQIAKYRDPSQFKGELETG